MKITFSADVEVPDGTPMNDIEAWLQFNLGATGQLRNENRLADTDLASIGCSAVNVRTRVPPPSDNPSNRYTPT
jgi:hypothetical protein